MITGTMPPTLRPACGSDYATVATWSTSAAACLRWAGPRLPFPFAAVDLERLLEIPGGGCSHVLASGTEPPLGFSQHWVAIPGAVHLGRIIVAPALRGHGLGRLLVERSIERAAREPGAQSVTDNDVAAGTAFTYWVYALSAQNTGTGYSNQTTVNCCG